MERRLLMIDDDIALGKLVQEFLTGEGWSCYWVDNGEEGYQEALALKPDVILLDLNLPRKDGREVLAEIKNDENLRSIPVVVLTSSRAEQDVLRSYNLHANCYITKPVDLQQFLTVVRAIEFFWLSIIMLPTEQIPPRHISR